MKYEDIICEVEKRFDNSGNKLRCVEISFDDIKKANYTGVYILCENDEIVYIGSAYSTRKKLYGRLRCHISKTRGSSFRRHVARELGGTDIAVEYISGLKLYVIQYQDLEQSLIEIARPRFNLIHNRKPKL